MPKKFGKEDASRMLFIHFLGSYFLVGAFVGSVSLWMIVAWHFGMAIPWLVISMAFNDWFLCLLAVYCFDLVRAMSEQEMEEDDSCFLSWVN
jgi:hypothetical protein